MPDLRTADLNTLVLESGRRIEALAKAATPDATEPNGKPLMLGERMRLLRDRLPDGDWRAFRSWSRARNAYVHAEGNTTPDVETLHGDYLRVTAALRQLAPATATAPAPLSPAEEAALREATPISPAPKRRGRKQRPRSKPSAATEPARPLNVTGHVLLAVAIVALLVTYYNC